MEGIHPNIYYMWSKDFLEAGKQRLVGDTHREADSQEVNEMRAENEQLKVVAAELGLKNCILTPALAGHAREKVCWAGKRRETNDPEECGREARDHLPGGTGVTDCMTDSTQSTFPGEVFNWLRRWTTLGTHFFSYTHGLLRSATLKLYLVRL